MTAALQPESSAALFGWARRAAKAGRKAAALEIAAAAAEACPSFWTSVNLASVQESAGDEAQARRTLQQAAAAYPADAHWAPLYLGLLEARADRLTEAAELLAQFLNQHPSHPGAPYHLGSVLALQRRFAEANSLFDRGTIISCGDRMKTTSRVIRFPDYIPNGPVAVPLTRQVCLEPGVEHTGAELIYFVGCSPRYFQLFSRSLCNSLAACSGIRCAVHFHLINPDTDTEASLVRLRLESRVPVSSSLERTTLEQFGLRQQRTYHACARFLILPDVLRSCRRPVLVADIDQLVVRDMRPLLAAAARHDVSLLRLPRQADNILSLVSASVVLLNATPGALRFSDTVAHVLAERMSDPAAIGWHLDQAALAVAYLLHEEISYHRLPPSIMDSTDDLHGVVRPPSEEATFWSVTFTLPQSASKLLSPLFLQFLKPSGT